MDFDLTALRACFIPIMELGRKSTEVNIGFSY
jgi:hypothetical protein